MSGWTWLHFKMKFQTTFLRLILNVFLIYKPSLKISLREKCLCSELFWSVFSRIRTEYREILRISLYSVRMWENTDQNDSEYGHFLCSISVPAKELDEIPHRYSTKYLHSKTAYFYKGILKIPNCLVTLQIFRLQLHLRKILLLVIPWKLSKLF